MAIDGSVIKLDLPELRELTAMMKRISASENQIAKRLNENSRIYGTDIEGTKNNQGEIYDGTRKILVSLANFP